MIFYLVAAMTPLFLWYITGREKKINSEDVGLGARIRLTLLGIAPMFLMFVLRNNHVGGDTPGFVRFFFGVRELSFPELFVNKYTKDTEWGYLVYVKLVSLFTNSYTIYFLMNGIIIFGSFFVFAIRNTKSPLMFFFFFAVSGTYSFVLTGLRQALAMSVMLWAFEFIKKKNLVGYVLVVMLASLFHKSAVICLMAYPLAQIKRTNHIMACYITLATVLMLGFSFFQDLFNELLGYGYSVESTGNGMIAMLMFALMFVLATWVIRDKTPGTSQYNMTFNLSAITVLFWLLRLISRTAERISYYFVPGLYAYFSTACEVPRGKFAGVMKWIIIVGSLVIYAYRSMGAYYAFFF